MELNWGIYMRKMAEDFERRFGRPLRFQSDHLASLHRLDLEGETPEAIAWVEGFRSGFHNR